MKKLRAPFPWFGGKSRVAHLVWDRFGTVRNYVEPFFGSGAVLLARPGEPSIETVNDADGYLANFWRALAADPDEVARYADWPVNEADLHARHRWLVESAAERVEQVKADPSFYDVKVAGWWVWGQCRGVFRAAHQVPNLSGEAGAAGRGIHASGLETRSGGLLAYMRALSDRLRRVRVCCGDFERVLGPAVTTCIGSTAIFLDPPYPEEGRSICYSQDGDGVWWRAREWALQNGNDPLLKIALCGYELPGAEMPEDWACLAWRASGGYGRSPRGRANAGRERIWFSPACQIVQHEFSFELREVEA